MADWKKGTHILFAVLLCTAALAVTAAHDRLAAQSHALEIVGTQRTTHLTQSLTFRPKAAQSRLTELRVRSGSLAIHLEAVEIVFADGTVQRTILQLGLPPGHQSPPIRVKTQDTIREILVTKRPGMRQGATTLQLLGKVIRAR